MLEQHPDLSLEALNKRVKYIYEFDRYVFVLVKTARKKEKREKTGWGEGRKEK
jgi:hypothetical protein